MIGIILFIIMFGIAFPTGENIEDNFKTPEKVLSKNIYEYEKIFEEMIYKINRLSQELKYIKDEQTAKRASVNIKRLLEQLAALDRKLQKIGIPSSDDMLAIEKKYGDRMKAAIEDFSNKMVELEKKEYALDIMELINPASK